MKKKLTLHDLFEAKKQSRQLTEVNTDDPIEAQYLFPLPDDAAVDRMDMTVGDRVIEGWVMERSAALQAYEQAKQDGQRAALLEQERENLFTQHISGICPGERVSITLQYTEPIDYEDGLYSLHFPTTVAPRYSPPWVHDAGRLDSPQKRAWVSCTIATAIRSSVVFSMT